MLRCQLHALFVSFQRQPAHPKPTTLTKGSDLNLYMIIYFLYWILCVKQKEEGERERWGGGGVRRRASCLNGCRGSLCGWRYVLGRRLLFVLWWLWSLPLAITTTSSSAQNPSMLPGSSSWFTSSPPRRPALVYLYIYTHACLPICALRLLLQRKILLNYISWLLQYPLKFNLFSI